MKGKLFRLQIDDDDVTDIGADIHFTESLNPTLKSPDALFYANRKNRCTELLMKLTFLILQIILPPIHLILDTNHKIVLVTPLTMIFSDMEKHLTTR